MISYRPYRLSSLIVSYFPQVGYLIAIPHTNTRDLETGVIFNENIPPEFEFQFETENCRFYKNQRMTQLDEELGDIYGVIADIEATILRELESLLLEQEAILISYFQSISELDCLISLAECARDFNFCRPNIVDQPYLEIRGGKHPLLVALFFVCFLTSFLY